MNNVVGLSIYNKQKQLKGKVTDQYRSETDDVDVLLIDDEYEVPAANVEYHLWTLNDDKRGEHLVFK